jgi:hypothetical protein
VTRNGTSWTGGGGRPACSSAQASSPDGRRPHPPKEAPRPLASPLRDPGPPSCITGYAGSHMLTDLTYIVPEQLPGELFSSARSRIRYIASCGMPVVVVSASLLS